MIISIINIRIRSVYSFIDIEYKISVSKGAGVASIPIKLTVIGEKGQEKFELKPEQTGDAIDIQKVDKFNIKNRDVGQVKLSFNVRLKSNQLNNHLNLTRFKKLA